jgi:DnaJ-class molecular chaperone
MKAESKFQMIQRAYDCLSDANSRYLYDKYGPEATVASWQLSKKFKSAKEVFDSKKFYLKRAYFG